MGNEESKQNHVDSASTAAASAAAAKFHPDHERYAGTPLYVWINKKKFVIPRDISPQMNLNTFLRDVVNLTGTKVMCAEGGCGACVVHVTKQHPTEPNEMEEHSVNSCLTPLLSCAGWQITTIEGIGNTERPHEVQKRMQEHSGTQCGYCTPGFCMQQYSTLRSKCCNENKKRRDGSKSGDGVLTETEMWENAFDGNICRCTGYRPILDAAKSFVKSKPNMDENRENMTDIEDLALFSGLQNNADRAFAFRGGEDGGRTMWYRPAAFDQLWQIMNGYAKGTATIRLVAGNTGEGVYKSAVPFNVYIDIKQLPGLSDISFTPQQAEFGSLITLTTLIEQFELNTDENFGYLLAVATHIRRVANHPVRNAGTWAGNLGVKHAHPGFPSDLCTLLTAVQAKIEVQSEKGAQLYTVPELMQLGEKLGRTSIMTKLILPPHPPSEKVFCSFKVTPREQNAHAHVNAAFLLPIRDGDATLKIYDTPTIAYGGLNPRFIRANNLENALRGQSVVQLLGGGAGGALSKVLSALADEVEVTKEDEYEQGKAEYRSRLTRNLLYKMLVFTVEAKKSAVVDSRVKNAWERIERPISSGKQEFETIKKDYPLTKPMPKVEALMQTTGQLQYTSDLHIHNQLYAAPILAPAAPAKLLGLTTDEAERVPGFVRIITSKDIPGVNSAFIEPLTPEVLLVDINGGEIFYAGQHVALALAETQPQAEAIAKLVQVQYKQTGKPILTCKDAIREKSFHPNKAIGELNQHKVGDVEKGFKEATTIVEGEVGMDQQYHFHMETQVALAEPANNGNNLIIHAGTQWPDHAMNAAAAVCGLHSSQVDVVTRPIGGGFGAKIARNMPIACLAALAAHVTRRPVKLHLSLWDNMKSTGCRYPYYTKYKLGIGADHKLKAVHITSYCNMGASPNDYGMPYNSWGDNAYKCDNWLFEPKLCKTNIPPNTHTRAPGSCEAAFFIETAMEHAAHAAGLDPLEFRRINYYKNGDTTFHEKKEERDGILKDVLLDTTTDELVKRVDYEKRKLEVAQYNANNRWKKRGYSVVPMKYACNYTQVNYCAQVVVHHADGSVAISHGGVEIGQGLNTKAAQTAAFYLGAPLDKVTVKPTISLNSAGAMMTGGSWTSEMVSYSVMKACEELKERMSKASVAKVAAGAAVALMKEPEHIDEAAWLARCHACYLEGIDLTARHWVNGLKWSREKDMLVYNAFGAMYCEVELDVLTGEKQVRHIELVHDVGESMSPIVDVGQAEGAIVFGLGLYLTEHWERDEETGKLLTHRTWEYKPPSSKDIPVKFNITFLKNVPNKLGMQRSKLIGEPPLIMTCSAIFALQHAVREARRELRSGGSSVGATNMEGINDGMEWVELDAPATCERLELLCDVQPEHLAVGNM